MQCQKHPVVTAGIGPDKAGEACPDMTGQHIDQKCANEFHGKLEEGVFEHRPVTMALSGNSAKAGKASRNPSGGLPLARRPAKSGPGGYAEHHERMENMQKTKRADSKINTESGLSYSVRIEATFGSEFQRTVAIKNLDGPLSSWKALVEAHHKKNQITVIRNRG